MAGTRVYIGRLPFDCRERDIERFFHGYGRIREVLIKNGFGFVEFDDDRDADDAVYELNGRNLLGEKVVLEIARGPTRRAGGSRFGFRRRGSWLDKYGPPTRTEYRLIVENLSSKVSWQDLKDFMRQEGEVTYADAHKQRRNEGCVEFASYSDMKNAYTKLNGVELSGRKIHLIEDRPRGRRSHSRSSSRSRSRSPRRRHSRSGSRSRSITRSRSKSPRAISRSRSRSRSHGKRDSRSLSPTHSPRHEKQESRSPSPARSPGNYQDRSPAQSPVRSDNEI